MFVQCFDDHYVSCNSHQLTQLAAPFMTTVLVAGLSHAGGLAPQAQRRASARGNLTWTGPFEHARCATSAKHGDTVCHRSGPACSSTGELSRLFIPHSHKGHLAEASTSPGRAPDSDHFAVRTGRHFCRVWRQVACLWPDRHAIGVLLQVHLRKPCYANSPPPTAHCQQPNGTTASPSIPGSGGGRCVQRAGT